LISSITPVRTARGCWALVVSNELLGDMQQRLGKPYWQNPEVGTAAALYALFAALVLIVALDLARVLARFVRTARGIASGQASSRFMAPSVPPELAAVGQAFDGMVASLRETAGELRVTAEENAHAFKSPLGTIRQALEPIRFRLGAADARARQALSAIDLSLDRLDGLVRLARNLEAATADRLDPPRDPVDLAILIEDVVETYASAATARGVGLLADLGGSATALRGGRLIADALGQGIENALGFAPKGGTVRLRLQRHGRRALMTVEDDGPGVPAEKLGEIFNRHASFRPGVDPNEMHFGLGLWVVRRNMEALGGTAMGANRPTGGFILTLSVPLA
jgi:two-component system sensor histidine kinase ChvG